MEYTPTLARPGRATHVAVRANLIRYVKSKIPDATKARVRVCELAHGRAAVMGLLCGTAVELATGESFLSQASTHAVPALLACMVAGASVGDRPLEEDDCLQELRLTRGAMAATTLLFVMEALWRT